MALSNAEYWKKRTALKEAKAQRLAEKVVAEQIKLYQKLYKKLSAEIDALFVQIIEKGAESLSRTQLWQFTKWQSLLDMTEKGFTGIAQSQISVMRNMLEEIFQTTMETTLEELGKKDFAFNIFNKQQMNSILNQVWSGDHYSNRIWYNSSKIAQRIKDDITQMVLNGKNPSDIKAMLMKDFKTTYSNADRIVRTEASYVYNEASKQAYIDAGLDKVEWLEEPDNRTCPICSEVGSADNGFGVGIYQLNAVPRCPTHPRCRCALSPVVELKTL